MEFRFLLPAEEEMTESAVFYERESKGLGSDFLDEVDRVVAQIRDYPQIGQAYTPNFRRYVLARFPFSILYAVEENELLIIAVAHHKRKPGFWKNR